MLWGKDLKLNQNLLLQLTIGFLIRFSNLKHLLKKLML